MKKYDFVLVGSGLFAGGRSSSGKGPYEGRGAWRIIRKKEDSWKRAVGMKIRSLGKLLRKI